MKRRDMAVKNISPKEKVQSQRDKFIAKAKELGVTTEKAFDAALKRIGTAKTNPPQKKKSK